MISPRVRQNDWGALSPPALGAWRPTRTVSVIIPAFQCQELLALALAALRRQTYPRELLEVLVADDGSQPKLELPEVVPENCRIVRVPDHTTGWGRANALRVGAAASDGEILHWLDADLVPFPEHVEAQARWHHAAPDVVTLGYKRFVRGQWWPGVDEVLAACEAGTIGALFPLDRTDRHEHVEETIDATDQLRAADHLAFRAHVGATAAVSRDLYLAAGGMDGSLRLGEDSELGYRLAQAGAVFVPEPQARSWHLGPSHMMRVGVALRRYNAPFLAERMPHPPWLRRTPGRSWAVPLVTAVVEAGDAPFELVRSCVDRLLASNEHDLRVVLVADWDALTDRRRPLLADPLLDRRLIAATYRSEPRVVFAAAAPETAFPSPYLLRVPVHLGVSVGTVRRAVAEADARRVGLLRLLPSGATSSVAELWRTAAVSRARRYRRPGEPLAEVVTEVWGGCWASGEEFGVVDLSAPAGPAAAAVRPVPVAGLRSLVRATGYVGRLAATRAWARARADRGARRRGPGLPGRLSSRSSASAAAAAEEAAVTVPSAPMPSGAGKPEPSAPMPSGAGPTGTGSGLRAVARAVRRRLRLRTRLRRAREAWRRAFPRPLPEWSESPERSDQPPVARPAPPLTSPEGAGVVVDATGANPQGRHRYGRRLPTGRLVLAAGGAGAIGWRIARVPDGTTVVAGRVGDPLERHQSAVLAELGVVRPAPEGIGAEGSGSPAPEGIGAESTVAAREPEASPLAWAHLLVQLAMTGVVVHAPDLPPAVTDRLAPELAGLVAAPLPARGGDPLEWEIRSVRQRRAAMRHHAAGFAPGPPATRPPPVSAVLVTKRPQLVAPAVAALAAQTYPELEIVVGRHGHEGALGDLPGGREIRVVSIPAERNLGEALAEATAAASGTLITKVDDDDRYGPEHVWDLVLARHYAGATVAGKGAELVYLEPKDLTVRRRMAAETYTDTVAGGTITLARDDLAAVGGWPAVPRWVDRALLDRVLGEGGQVYRTHPLGFVYTRHDNGHTWEAELDHFVHDAQRKWRGLPPYQEFGTA